MNSQLLSACCDPSPQLHPTTPPPTVSDHYTPPSLLCPPGTIATLLPLKKHICKILGKGAPGAALSTTHRSQEDRSEGAAYFRDTLLRRHQPVDTIRHILPSTKTPLTTLREHITDDVTTEPKTQAKIIKKFWGGIWSKRPEAANKPSLDRYLRFYNKHIPETHTPIFPTLKTVQDQILKPRDTSPGPDGLPFALYRSLVDITGPLILDIIIALGTGEKPPKEFNLGGLCIFPKDNSFTIARTRPITLNNVSNRLAAAIVADAIMDAVDAIADKRQKGFIRGRLGEDNIK